MGVEGYRDFKICLDKLEINCKKAKWLEEATLMVAEDAVRRAPFRTGELANSINYEMGENEQGRYGCVYTDCDHSLYVEFGTGKKGAQSNPELPEGVSISWDMSWEHGQAAQPYMYPALKNNTQKILDMANKDIKKAVGGK